MRNRDLDVTQLTVVLWWAFLILTVPMIVWGQLHGVVNPPAEQAYQFVWLAAVVLLLRNAVLRSRELHADARAATWS